MNSRKQIADSIAKNIAELRKQQERSLDDVASLAGLSKSHVWELEKGCSANPSVATLIQLASAFGVKPSRLLEEFDRPTLHPLALRVAVDVDQAFREGRK